MEYKNKGKLKEQNSRRITEPKNGLLPKGKGLWRMDGKGGIRAEKKKGGLTISTYSVWGHPREGCATQRRLVVILQHLTTLMDSDCIGVGGGLAEGGSLVNIMFFI